MKRRVKFSWKAKLWYEPEPTIFCPEKNETYVRVWTYHDSSYGWLDGPMLLEELTWAPTR